MTTLYISGGMSGLPDHNFPAFYRAEEALTEAGFWVVNPARRGIILGWTWADYLRVDLQEMLCTDGIAALPGFWLSRGAMLESHLAVAVGIPVKPIDEWLEAR